MGIAEIKKTASPSFYDGLEKHERSSNEYVYVI
jgi:hypothetical protein